MDQNNEFFVVLDEPTRMSTEYLKRKQEKLSEGCCTVYDAGNVAFQDTVVSESVCSQKEQRINPIDEPGDGYQYSPGESCGCDDIEC